MLTNNKGVHAAKALPHLGPHIIGVNRRGGAVDGCAQVVTMQQLDEVLPKADVLYLAMPETEATRGLINKRLLDLLKPSCSVVNVGRQSAMDYHAWAAKLTGGELAGALLDVFTPEPIADDSY